jgi:hypothetical protein
MLLTPHTFVGVAIGATVANPLIAVPLSFLMHFAGDKVPHWDFYSNTKKEERLVGWRPLAVMADLMTGVAIGLTFTYYTLWVVGDTSMALNIFLCGIASVLPDALEGPYIFMKKEPRFLQPITQIQKRMQFQAPLPWGLLTQVGVIVISAVVILNKLGLF